jgi:hypothetical protein
MASKPATHFVPRRFLVLIFLGALGCNEQSLPPAADSGRARAALETSLKAWQKGESVESLKSLSPPIYFNDSEWNDRNRLIRYEIESEEANALSWRCRVILTVQSGHEKPKERKTSYLIDTDPAIVIVRDSMK